MAVITVDQVKAYTTLTDDAAIAAMIPIIDAKVKMITGNRWNWQVIGITDSTKYVEVQSLTNYAGITFKRDKKGYAYSGINAPYFIDDLYEYLNVGDQVSGDGIPAGAYIANIYANGDTVTLGGTRYSVPVIELDQAATATANDAQLFLNISIGYLPTIAKGVQWLIEQSSAASADSGQRGVLSKRMGPVSVQYGEGDSKIDGKSGMPAWFVKALPHFHGGH